MNDNSELDTKGRLGQLLTAIALGEDVAEHAAAQRILKFEATPDYPLQLTELVSDPNQPAKMRILACSKLQDYLKSHWCSTAEDQFLAPEIDEKNKTIIRKLLFPIGLKESEREVREGVADIIICIFLWEWPHNWPQFFEMLLDCLRHAGEPSAFGRLQFFKKFVSIIAKAHVPSIGVVILDRIIRICICKDEYSVETRCLACSIFLEFVCHIVACGSPDIIQRYLKPAVLRFTEISIQIWTSRESDEEFKSSILNVLEVLMTELPKYISGFLTNMLPLVWGTLIDCAKDYKANVVDAGDGQEKQDMVQNSTRMGKYSDGLVKAILKFLQQLMYAQEEYSSDIPNFKLLQNEWIYLQDCFTTPDALRHVIMMIEVTGEHIKLWNTDFDEFVEQECMFESNEDGIREIAVALIICITREGRGIRSSLNMVIMKYLEQENEKRIDGQSGVGQNSWKSHEAFLVVFCVMKNCIVGKENGNSSHYDVVPFLDNIVLADLVNNASHPILVCRCLAIGGLYSGQMPKRLGSAFLEATVKCLQENQPTLVKISAVRAVGSWYNQSECEERNDLGMLLPHLPALFEGLLTFAESVKSAEVYQLCMRRMACLMPFDKTLTATLASRIYSLIETALLKYGVGVRSNEWLTVFEEFTLNHDCQTFLRKLVTEVLPKMMIIGPLENYRTGSAALPIITVLAKNSPLPLYSFLTDTLFFAACNYMISIDKWQYIRGDGMNLIKTYISVASEEVLSYRDENGRYGAQYILQVVLYDLSQKTYPTRTGEACEILILLIKKSWYEIRENIDAMLTTLLHCTRNEKIAYATRKLSMVYALLISRESDTVFKFISNALSPLEQKSSLELIISEGLCKQYPSVIGKERKTVKLALGKVLEHAVTNPSSPLYRITLEESSGGPIPLLVKICRLVVDDEAPVESTDNQK